MFEPELEPDTAPPTIEELLRERHWTQFQFYGIFPDKIILQLAGRVTAVELVGLRIICKLDWMLSLENKVWKDADSTEFMIPGPTHRLTFGRTPKNRLLIFSIHPRESVLTVLFPEGDDSAPEIISHRGDEIKLEPLTAPPPPAPKNPIITAIDSRARFPRDPTNDAFDDDKDPPF